jgi:chromosome segregation protein
LEAALGAALGEALESPSDASAARHWRNLPPLAVAQALPDGAVPLSRLVEAPAALARALSQVGLLARGMDGATLQAGLRPGQALVTEEGAVWRWDGHTHHAGTPTPGAVRLAQRNALRAAEARLDHAEVTAAEAEAARIAAEAAEAEAASAEAAARNARSAAEVAASAARRAEGELAARDARAESRIAALEPQLTRLAEDRAEADATRAEAEALYTTRPDIALLRQAEQAAARAEAEARNAEATAREARRRAEMALADSRQRQAALLNRASEVENRLAALAPQLERIGAELAEAEAARANAAQAREAAPDLVQLRETVEAARANLAEQRAAEAASRDAQGALAAEVGSIAARRASLANEASLWAARAEDASARVADLRRRDAEAEAEREALAAAPEAAALRRAEAARLLEQASEAHATAAAALAAAERRVSEGSQARRSADTGFALAREEQVRLGEGAELPPAPEELSDVAEDKARRKVERLVRERDEMGPVNLRADIEIAEIEERIGQITHDRDEVMNAIAKLRGSIGHLNREGRERLREVFDRVDIEFRSLFTRLFGGGRAHLALVGSDDPLEAGLEIYAEPPGKKLSTLSLLSGGEQALTALSLIFAVFRCNPAPVCVLDEVDAPLDDANVERLCDLLDAMAAESGTRFLIVTHHPLTMGRMHRLYGVTMQERGVSRLLSVDLGRAIELAETSLL